MRAALYYCNNNNKNKMKGAVLTSAWQPKGVGEFFCGGENQEEQLIMQKAKEKIIKRADRLLKVCLSETKQRGET